MLDTTHLAKVPMLRSFDLAGKRVYYGLRCSQGCELLRDIAALVCLTLSKTAPKKGAAMKRIPLALGVLVLASTGMSQSPETHLLGCADTTKIANALGHLDQARWENISVERVLSTWPSPLKEFACQSEKGCRVLVSEDRVISGHCECCESFVFDTAQKASDARSESLNNIIIHYSARTKGGVVQAAQELARSVGLSSTQAAKIGNELVQRFDWKGLRESAQQSYILEVKFTPVGHNWELYLSLGAERIPS
jgi:hypothetical protein